MIRHDSSFHSRLMFPVKQWIYIPSHVALMHAISGERAWRFVCERCSLNAWKCFMLFQVTERNTFPLIYGCSIFLFSDVFVGDGLYGFRVNVNVVQI